MTGQLLRRMMDHMTTLLNGATICCSDQSIHFSVFVVYISDLSISDRGGCLTVLVYTGWQRGVTRCSSLCSHCQHETPACRLCSVQCWCPLRRLLSIGAAKQSASRGSAAVGLCCYLQVIQPTPPLPPVHMLLSSSYTDKHALVLFRHQYICFFLFILPRCSP